MLKADYNRAVALCKESIDGGFDLTVAHAAEANVPFVAVQSLRRQMFSRLTQRTGYALYLVHYTSYVIPVCYTEYVLHHLTAAGLESGDARFRTVRKMHCPRF